MAIRKVAETAFDRTRFALSSLGTILRKPKYLVLFLVTLVFFLYFLSFFKDGNTNLQLIFSGLDFGRKLEVLGRVFIGIGENITSLYGISIILLSILQSLVIIELVFAWRHRKRDKVLDGVSTGGIGAVLGFIALGCPSCGIGLLTPILSAIAGASAAALAESIGCFLTIAAFILLIYTVVHLGYINYITIVNDKSKEKHAKSH